MAQVVISIAASDDDAYRQRTDTVYPPVTNAVGDTTATFIDPRKTFSTPNYNIVTWCLRFDTSSIPDDATVTAATLNLFVGNAHNADTRNMNCEWYPWTPPLVAGDYAETVGTTAAVFPIINVGAGGRASFDIILSDPAANISKTGFTGIRMGTDGGVPTGDNGFFAASFDHASETEPRLIVNYDPFQGTAATAWITA